MSATVSRCCALCILLLVVVAVLGYADSRWVVNKLLARRGYGYKSVIFNIFAYQTHDKSLTDYGAPEVTALLCSYAEELAIVMPVALNYGCSLSDKQSYEVVNLKLVANAPQSLQCGC
jgi:hypothetical protein